MSLAPVAPFGLVIVLIALLVAAAAEDAWRLRISNIISGLVLLCGIVVMALNFDWSLWQNLAVCAALLVVGVPLFGAGMFGGGDIKLLAATGLWFSLKDSLQLLLWVFVAGGVLALVVIAARFLISSQRLRARWKILTPKGGIPYGVAIAAGAIATVWAQAA